MYENIGEKIKGLAVFYFIIGSFLTMISGVAILSTLGTDVAWWAIFIIILGPISAWVGSWLLYGFGEMITLLGQIERNTKNIKTASSSKKGKKLSPKSEYKVKKPEKIVVDMRKTRDSQKHQNQNTAKELYNKLSKALALDDDKDMIDYLHGIKDERVSKILQAPERDIRYLVLGYVEELHQVSLSTM